MVLTSLHCTDVNNLRRERGIAARVMPLIGCLARSQPKAANLPAIEAGFAPVAENHGKLMLRRNGKA